MSSSSSTSSTRPIRVVLVDDHALVRSGLRAELGEPFVVVGEADEAEGAIDVINAHRPDLVICDLHLPRGGGLAVVKACAPLAPIVILTVSEAERDLLDAVAAGAAGYLVKSTPIDELRVSLRKAAGGEPVFSPSLAALVLGEFRRPAKQAGSSPLTDREREVLQLVGSNGNTKSPAAADSGTALMRQRERCGSWVLTSAIRSRPSSRSECDRTSRLPDGRAGNGEMTCRRSLEFAHRRPFASADSCGAERAFHGGRLPL